MKRVGWVVVLALTGSAISAPVSAQTTVIPWGTYTGGSSFATSLTGGMTYLNGVLTVTLQNNGPGVFAAIGIVGAPKTGVTQGTAPTGWTWNTTNQLGGAGLPNTTWAWIAPPPPSQSGLQVGGGTYSFSFNIGTASYSGMGFAVHAISGPGGCSTKFGVWNGGQSTNDVVAKGGSYDPKCVDVPEPESLALFATGVGGLAFVAARRRRRGALELVDENGDVIEI